MLDAEFRVFKLKDSYIVLYMFGNLFSALYLAEYTKIKIKSGLHTSPRKAIRDLRFQIKAHQNPKILAVFNKINGQKSHKIVHSDMISEPYFRKN